MRRAAESDRKAGFDNGTTAAVIGVESSFDSGAISNKGAGGIFQIMPENVDTYSKEVGRRLNPHNNDAFLMYDKLMAERRRHYNGDTHKMLRSYQPRYQMRLIKTDNRKTVDGNTPTSVRSQGANGITNLARWLGDGSSIISPRCGFHFACWKVDLGWTCGGRL